MLLAAAAIIISQAILAGILVLAVRWWIRRQVRQAADLFQAELVKLVNGEPCQAAAVLNAAGQVIGSQAGRSAKAALMAELSHIKRAENAAAGDQQLSLISDNSPGIGQVLAGIGPNKRSKLMSNPLVQLAMSALLGGGSGGPAGPPGPANNGGSSRSVRDRLQRGG